MRMRTSTLSASVLGCFLACAYSVVAQDITIFSIDVPGGGGTAFTVGTYFLSFVNFTASNSFIYADHKGSYELIAGPKESTRKDVIDVMCINEDMSGLGCSYYFSRSIPAGSYHFRVNITNTTTPPALSDTFNVAAYVPDCVPPPPWTNITSTSDPNYTSMQITDPAAGYAISIGPDKAGEVLVGWTFRDARNTVNAGVNNITFEFVNFKTGQATGLLVWKTSDLTSELFAFAGTDVSVGGWRIRANYSNVIEGSPPGSTVSLLGEEFFIVGEEGDCEGIGHNATAPGQSGGSGQGGGSGQSGGSGQGGSSGVRPSGTEGIRISGMSWIIMIALATFSIFL